MTRTDSFILPFSDIRAVDLPLVGGKGANLGELTHAGFPVPDGFCLTTTAFLRFMASCPDAERIYASLDTVTPDDLESVRRVGQQVRETLLQTSIPAEIAVAVRQAWQEVGVEHAYAVRSSATAEDLPGASFAGQQDTYLNVRGEADLLDAVRRCWASLFTDRAILYRCENHFPHREVQLSVVVQRMIVAEKSGILFTADPLTGHRHTLSIDASYGLGEALVSGLVTPDSYRVDKRTRAILERRIADKRIAITPEKEGGVRQVTIPQEQRQATVLNDEQILALTDLGCRVEALYDAPQDIEWAIADGKIHLLQARPITSLYPIDGLQSPDGTLHIYFSVGHQQNMTRAMAPLSLTCFPLLLPVEPLDQHLGYPVLRASGDRLFADITALLRHPILRKVIFGLLSQFDALAPETLQIAMRRPEFRGPHGLHISFAAFKSVAGLLRQVGYALWRQDLTGFIPQTNALMDRFTEDMARRLHEAPPGKARLQAVQDALPTLFPFFLNWIPQFVAGEIAKRLLTRLGRKWLTPDELNALTLGLPGNVVTEMNLAIGDLADLARRSPQLVDWFSHLGNDSHVWLEQAAQLEGSEPFLDAWDDFLARYGARGPAEIDIAMPRWYEEPLPVLKIIAAHLQEEPGGQRAQQRELVQAREAAARKLLEGAGRGILGGLRVRLFKRLLHVLTAAGGLREHHKFLAIKVLALVKEVLKQTATQLTAQGKLSRPDDFWFLTWEELLAIWDDETTDWDALIPPRRADLRRFQKLTPPMVITSDGETPVVQYHVDDAPPGALLGNPVSPGIVEGVVHVVHDPQTDTLASGEILVATFTDPGWTPLFINAAGLIMEIGGAMNHGSVVAREYGIPAVVGVRGATTRLQTGQRVRLDGNRGVIEILSDA
ncbi:MAG TPA: phosphoenolpyruvate synthase [Caldilineae bacterium]|nr:phosphoenolpyruvate synthase [Caldilineae bacterium]